MLTQKLLFGYSLVIDEPSPLVWFAKFAGAAGGSLISVAYILPKGRRDAFLRLTVGIVTGLAFGGTAGVKIADFLGLLEKISAIEVALMGATLASLSAWWGLGIAERMATQWRRADPVRRN